jgi:hypothetical protein
MRYKLFIFLPFLFFIKFDAEAQAKKIKFHSINSIGFVAGESGTDMILQSVNGIMYKNLYSGVGFGADYYNYNSYPLFFDQRIYFAKNKKTFVYGDLGYNFPGKNRPGKEIYYYNSFHFSGGIYTDFGIGYKLKFINKSFFTFSSGFAYKEINNKVGTLNPCLVGPCPVDYNYYKYRNGRVVLKAGVDF